MTALAEALPLAQGRTARFRALYDRQIGFAYNFLRRLGVGAPDVEDVAQETFTQLYVKLDDYDPARPERAWVAGFAVRCAASYRRARRSREVSADVEHEPAVSSGREQRDTHEVVMRALAPLSDELREVLVLHDLFGHEMAETAAILQIPLNTGYSRLRVARTRFRETVVSLGKEAR